MRRRYKTENIFIGLTLNSLVALVGIVGLMIVFAKSFGELAIPAINIMSFMMDIPIATLGIGILGWIFARNFDR